MLRVNSVKAAPKPPDATKAGRERELGQRILCVAQKLFRAPNTPRDRDLNRRRGEMLAKQSEEMARANPKRRRDGDADHVVCAKFEAVDHVASCAECCIPVRVAFRWRLQVGALGCAAVQ